MSSFHQNANKNSWPCQGEKLRCRLCGLHRTGPPVWCLGPEVLSTHERHMGDSLPWWMAQPSWLHPLLQMERVSWRASVYTWLECWMAIIISRHSTWFQLILHRVSCVWKNPNNGNVDTIIPLIKTVQKLYTGKGHKSGRENEWDPKCGHYQRTERSLVEHIPWEAKGARRQHCQVPPSAPPYSTRRISQQTLFIPTLGCSWTNRSKR